MVSVAVVSAVLSAALFFLARYEYLHAVRVGGTKRMMIDRRITHQTVVLGHWWHRAVDAIQRDLFARILHILSYLALMSVRAIERKLDRLTTLFRSFRKRKHGPHAPRMRRLTDKDVEDDTVR